MQYVCEVTTASGVNPTDFADQLRRAGETVRSLGPQCATHIEIANYQVQFLDATSSAQVHTLFVIEARDLNDLIRRLQRTESPLRWQIAIHALGDHGGTHEGASDG